MKQFARKVFHGGAMEFSAYDQRGRRKYLTPAEGRAFLKGLDALAPEERTFCEFLYFTGCRISEALAVAPSSDLDLSEGVVLVKTLKKRKKREVRRIPLPPQFVNNLSDRFVMDGEHNLWPFSRTSGWRIVKRAMENAGIRGVCASPKGLRHGFAIRSVLAKVPLTTIQRWMGHSCLDTTAIYLDARDAEERELMSRTWET